ncbi:DNA gyrase, A subunit [Chthoniobacter flavus Ellin428]|uniref:DNA gyrase subunit A n=1 Tax=Chthoniobacter flavus Ellin428 TaxID=497964 RepID=B4D634_9BACT|nr:DNA gyrase subunit A [Chthoniobacter flavus]EDY18237.1 DNA gyrase, A subunit [Chthoniobacter flavus Ellin428]TCO91414.1 DNA gyrase subunit A [Chthoniobacter flavus]
MPNQNPNEKVQPMNVAEEMSKSFLDYSMSVIISRALPDARDGLKPSQRRILVTMNDLGVLPNRKHIKCAKIVGDTMGNYHPHGDQAIYPTLVHMAQPWAMRDMLVDGQGNFGSVEGDPPASMRYTEARLRWLGASLMDDMDKETVDFVPTYDERLMEPVVLPAAFPNLLVNGGTGIAVGMATNIPPHNLSECINGICAQIDNPNITLDELMQYVKGPDFPTGCILQGSAGIRSYFETGRGSVRVRGRASFEEAKGGREQIIVTEIPYNVNRAELVKRIAELANEKVLTGISDVRDESDENTRVVIDLKRDGNPKVILNNLFKHTALESSFSVNMLAIDHGRPRLLGLKDAIACYIEHRREIILRRTRFLLNAAEVEAEKLEGFLIALANLDDFIRIIRDSRDRDDAKAKLMALSWARAAVEQLGVLIRSEARVVDGQYKFTEKQVGHILDLRLYQLTGLERESIKDEYDKLLVVIRDLMDILAKEHRVLTIIKDELRAIQDKYGSERRTEIVPEQGEIAIEDLIANEGVIVTLTHNGFIKRTAVSAYRAQRRGGKGVIGMTAREGETEEDSDFVEHLFTATTHDYLMFFTVEGRCYVERVFEIPEGTRTSKGRSIANVLELRQDEKIAATIRIQGQKTEEETWSDKLHIVFATRSGIVKKSNLNEFKNIRKGGIIAIQIETGDRLIDCKLTTGLDEIVLITHEGMSIRFNEGELRDQGRNTVGVWGIRPDTKDYVVAAALVNKEAMLLVAGENGIGKRTGFDEYRIQSRGGKGIITMKTTDKTGSVAGALTVVETDELMLITNKGKMVRTRVAEIRETGRNAQGVKLIDLRENEILQGIAPVVSNEDEEKAEGEPESAT